MNNSLQDPQPRPAQADSSGIDIKRIVFQAVRFWYVFAASLILFVSIAFLINRYSTRVYNINASIIIKEAEELSGGELLYNNPLMKGYRNYLNELYIIRSKPLIERTVAELGFNKFFYAIGDLKRTQIYKNAPIEITVLDDNSTRSVSFGIETIDNEKVKITYSHKGEEVNKTVSFGEWIEIDGNTIKLSKTTKNATLEAGLQYQYVTQSVSNVADGYVSRLAAEWAEEGSGVVNLSINGSDPEREADFLNALIDNFQALDLEKKNVAASNAIGFINEQLSNISDSLNQAERQLELFKNKNIVTDLNSEALRLYQKIEGLEVQKTELVIRGSYYNYLTDYINKSPDLDQVILPTSVGLTDPILSGLISEMIKIQTSIKLMTRPGKLQNPAVSADTRQMEELKADILESVKNQKAIDKIKLDFLKKEINLIEKQLSYLPKAERQLVNIKRNYSLLENLYTYLLQKRAEAGITKASNTTDIVVVNPPATNKIISPRKSRNYLLGFAVGLIGPLMLFVLIEVFNTKIQSREDIEKITSIPFIGGVGHKRESNNIEVLVKPKSAISEAFRAIRSNLQFFIGGKSNGVFLITSSISGEGKTFSSINMAAVFALSGKRTLIVGADMRKPKIFSDFNLTNDTGLSNYLAGLADFPSVVQKTSYANLDLVSAGPVPPNPSELIMTDRMQEFLKLAKEKYDLIFIDSPPLALVTDAFVLSALVDHTLFIVRQNYTPKDLLAAVNEYYSQGKIKNMSIVLNDIVRSGPGYGYGYSYGYGYGYGYGNKSKESGGYYEN